MDEGGREEEEKGGGGRQQRFEKACLHDNEQHGHEQHDNEQHDNAQHGHEQHKQDMIEVDRRNLLAFIDSSREASLHRRVARSLASYVLCFAKKHVVLAC